MNFKNEYFDSAECPFEVLGFFEEFIDGVTCKALGYRSIPKPTRRLGGDGMIAFDLKETITLTKGFKQVTIKASPKQPRRVITMIQIHCGKMKER